jgi:hypothetical protein
MRRLCGKTEKGALGRFDGRLSARGLDPQIISDADIRRELKIAKIEGRADARAQIHTFVNTVNTFCSTHQLHWVKLKSYPGPREKRAQAWQALPEPLKRQANAFLAARALQPTKKKSRHKDGVVAFVTQGTINGERAGIHRCVDKVAAAGDAPTELAHLITRCAVKSVARAFGDENETSATRIFDLLLLGKVAGRLGDARAAEFIRRISKCCKKPPPEISNAALLRLAPYFDRTYLKTFLGAVERAASLPAAATDEALYRAESAIAILAMIHSMSQPKFACGLLFSGPDRPIGDIERARLAHVDFKVKDFEKIFETRDADLGADFREILDAHHNHLFDRLDRRPAGPFVDARGEVRVQHQITYGVNQLLDELGADLTLMDLRDLGVAIKIMAGNFTTTQLAALSRYHHPHFVRRFSKLIDVIDNFKQGTSKE